MNDKLSLQLLQTPVGRFELHILNLDYNCHFFHLTNGAFRWDDLSETQAQSQILSPFDIGEERIVDKIGNPNPQLAYWYCFDFKLRRGSQKQGPVVGMFQAVIPIWTHNGWRQISAKPLEIQLTKRRFGQSIKDYYLEKKREHAAELPEQRGLNWLGGLRVDYWNHVERNHMRRTAGYKVPKTLQLPPNTLLKAQYADMQAMIDARYRLAEQQTATRLGQEGPVSEPTTKLRSTYAFPRFRQVDDIPLMLYVSRYDGLVHIVNDLGHAWDMRKAMVEGQEITQDEFNRVADDRAAEHGWERVSLDRFL